MRHSEKLFLHIVDTNTYTSNASDLPRPMLGHIFEDAADLGMLLVTHNGDNIKFYIDEEEFDAEGEVVAWHLLPDPASARKMPQYKTAKIIIFKR